MLSVFFIVFREILHNQSIFHLCRHATRIPYRTKTRTTRMPVCSDTPRHPWLPILVIHIRSQVKTKQSQSYKSLIQILKFCKKLYMQHTFWSCLIRYKYQMDPTRSVGATERTWDAGWMDGRMYRWRDGQTDGAKPIYYPPNNFVVWGLKRYVNLKYEIINNRGPCYNMD